MFQLLGKHTVQEEKQLFIEKNTLLYLLLAHQI